MEIDRLNLFNYSILDDINFHYIRGQKVKYNINNECFSQLYSYIIIIIVIIILLLLLL